MFPSTIKQGSKSIIRTRSTSVNDITIINYHSNHNTNSNCDFLYSLKAIGHIDQVDIDPVDVVSHIIDDKFDEKHLNESNETQSKHSPNTESYPNVVSYINEPALTPPVSKRLKLRYSKSTTPPTQTIRNEDDLSLYMSQTPPALHLSVQKYKKVLIDETPPSMIINQKDNNKDIMVEMTQIKEIKDDENDIIYNMSSSEDVIQSLRIRIEDELRESKEYHSDPGSPIHGKNKNKSHHDIYCKTKLSNIVL